MIFFKPNVRLKRYTPAIRFILETLDNLNRLKIPNYPEDWVITSVNDSVHKKDSKHYLDLAVDMRSKNFENENRKEEFRDRLEFAMGNKFTVLYENPGGENQHFHIQVKKGMVYP